MATQHPDALARQHFMDAVVRSMAADPETGGYGWHLVAFTAHRGTPHIGSMTFETWRPLRGLDDVGQLITGRCTVDVDIVIRETPQGE